MAQVTPNTSYNVIKVSSVGLQGATGAPGPTGSLQPSNSGSFSITGSLTVSGSGTLTNIGPAIFSGSVTSTSGFTGSLAGTATTASYINPTFISASAAASGFGGGGNTNTGSLMVTGSVSNSTLTFTKGDGSTFPLTINNVINATSASFATTASFALNVGATVSTASLLVTASATNNVLTFTKGDSSTFTVTVNTGSATTVDTGSLMVTGSATNNVLTFTKGDGSTFNLTVATGSSSGTTDTGSLLTTGSVSNATLTFTKGNGSTFPLTINNVVNATSASYALTASYALSGGSGGGGSTFPFSGSAVITGSLIISGTLGGGAGDTKGLQISNNGSNTLRVNSNTGTSFIIFEGSTTQMYLASNNPFGSTQVSNMFFNTTFSGMGDGSGLGFINFAQGSGTSNDSFGSIRTYLRGADKSEVRIFSQTAVGGNHDIAFISGSLIDVNRKIETDQDIEITDSSKGIILRSPNGTRYRITINDSGILVSGSI